MKTYLTMYLLIILSISTINAQWTNTILHPSFNLNSVEFIDANLGFTTGSDGGVLRTTDKGNTWIICTIPVARSFYGITAVSENNIWVCGDSGSVFKSVDDGDSWVDKSINTSVRLEDIYFQDQNIGFAVGESGLIAKSIDGGNTWSLDTLTNMGTINDIFFLSSQIGWAVGAGTSYPYGWVWKTNDGGSSWSKIGAAEWTLYAVEFINESTGYFAGRGVFKSTNGGVNLSNVINLSWYLYDLSFINSDLGWASGNDGSLYKTTNGGQDWVSQSPDFGGGRHLLSITFTDANSGYTCGYGDIMWLTTDGGTTWRKQAVGMPILNDVFAIDQNTVWAVGGANILFTKDGGSTWSITSPAEFPSNMTPSFYSVHFVNSLTGWIAGGNGFIFKTSDGGYNWIQQKSYTNQLLRSICFVDENNGWAGGTNISYNDAFYFTSDGGANWIDKDFGTQDDFTSIYFLNSDIGFLASNLKLYKTTNGGANWDVFSTGTYAGFKDVRFLSENVGWASGASFLRTTDAGISWANYAPPSGHALVSIYFADELIGKGGGFSGLYNSNDGGISWTKQSEARVSAVSFVDKNNGWAVGYDDDYFGYNTKVILKTNNGGTTSVDENQNIIVTDYILQQNYPNPFNPNTSISFSLPKNEFVTLKIYDILGKEITSLINEELSAGNHIKTFDATNLSSGVYFYSIKAGSFNQTKKMILAK